MHLSISHIDRDREQSILCSACNINLDSLRPHDPPPSPPLLYPPSVVAAGDKIQATIQYLAKVATEVLDFLGSEEPVSFNSHALKHINGVLKAKPPQSGWPPQKGGYQAAVELALRDGEAGKALAAGAVESRPRVCAALALAAKKSEEFGKRAAEHGEVLWARCSLEECERPFLVGSSAWKCNKHRLNCACMQCGRGAKSHINNKRKCVLWGGPPPGSLLNPAVALITQ